MLVDLSSHSALAADPNNARTRQATQWATALGIRLEDLLPLIPEIPGSLLAPRGDLTLLTLVPFHIGNVELCKAAGLEYEKHGYTNKTLVPVDDRHDFSQVKWRWVLAHDGSPNLYRKPDDCLRECIGTRFAGVDKVGVAIWLIHGARKHVMDLPGSRHADYRGYCAFVGPFVGPDLRAYGYAGVAHPRCGAVVFVWE